MVVVRPSKSRLVDTVRDNIRRSGLVWLPRRFGTYLLIASGLLAATGCTAIGPGKLVASHEGYNDAVQLTMTREVLKNIVRKRYADPMQFISVSSINAQFSVNAGASAGGSGLGTSAEAGQVGGNVGYSESPTITYLPQSDAGFDKSIDSPIELQEAISYLFNWGRLAQYEVGLVIGAINDAPDRQGQAGESYRERVDALTRLFENGAILRQFREFYPRHVPIQRDEIGGRAYVDAAKSGFYFIDAGAGQVNLASKHLGIGLVVPQPHEGAMASYLHALGLKPGAALYPLRSPGEAEPEPFGLQPDTIWLAPRSVESMFELAAMRVDVPPEHSNSGIAPAQRPAFNSSVSLPMHIHHAKEQPDSVYRIRHRGYWFYIDDIDTDSKQLFTTLVDAYTSRIGSKAPSDGAPQIVLPVGSG